MKGPLCECLHIGEEKESLSNLPLLSCATNASHAYTGKHKTLPSKGLWIRGSECLR